MEKKVHRLNSNFTPEKVLEDCVGKHPKAESMFIIGADRLENGNLSFWLTGSNMSPEQKAMLQSYFNAWFYNDFWGEVE